jgi:hypothetical protein
MNGKGHSGKSPSRHPRRQQAVVNFWAPCCPEMGAARPTEHQSFFAPYGAPSCSPVGGEAAGNSRHSCLVFPRLSPAFSGTCRYTSHRTVWYFDDRRSDGDGRRFFAASGQHENDRRRERAGKPTRVLTVTARSPRLSSYRQAAQAGFRGGRSSVRRVPSQVFGFAQFAQFAHPPSRLAPWHTRRRAAAHHQ